jgi:hypothetical protein
MDCFTLDGQAWCAAASTNTREVVLFRGGQIVAKLGQPVGNEFDDPTANRYYADGGSFVPCDVVWLPESEKLIVVTGYSAGDFALSASRKDGVWQWTGAAFGGSVKGGGLLSTGHGIEVDRLDNREIVQIASRSHGRIFGFTPDGALVKLPNSANNEYHVQMPTGSTPCDIAIEGSKSFVPLLNKLSDFPLAAPVIVLEDNRPVGSLVPAAFEGLQFMRHMHGIRTVVVDDNLYAVVLSWPNGGENAKGDRNDGRIAIFEAVPVEAISAVAKQPSRN